MRLRTRRSATRQRPRDVEAYHAKLAALAATGEHRDAAGGLWDEMGDLVVRYLVDQGLRPEDRVLDIGCGPLRIGVPLVRYLDADRYFGLDAHEELLAAGYDVELADAGLQHKLPRSHLHADRDFRLATLLGDRTIDVALAQSVFTHLPLNHLRLCLLRLAAVTAPGAVLHATFFVVADDTTWAEPVTQDPGGITTYPTENPFHYTVDDLERAAGGLPWSVAGPFDFGHPRSQRMVRFTREPDGTR